MNDSYIDRLEHIHCIQLIYNELTMMHYKCLTDQRPKIIPRVMPRIIHCVHISALTLSDINSITDDICRAGNADEFCIINTSDNKIDNVNWLALISEIATYCYVPLIVGGPIRSVDDAEVLIRAGADRIIIEIFTNDDLELVLDCIDKLGQQAVICAFKCMAIEGHWEICDQYGHRQPALDGLEYIWKVAGYGISELLITSLNSDGTSAGYDADLFEWILKLVLLHVTFYESIYNLDNAVLAVAEAKVTGVMVNAGLGPALLLDNLKLKLIEYQFPIRPWPAINNDIIDIISI